ncbi:sigma-70 family RNA polymerase sigma factor [Streptomyces synnematoformans]|uniref:Sigma-70 family RNA polymerase sigma factor n=1 Tax=Streptomyces synnematoformans TaxID=415721 RepID=A0ABN2ZBE3_9ACTN
MHEHDWLAERFETDRPRLRAVAYRMLGSTEEAEDAVQEAWIRLSRSDTSQVENLGGWLTTIVARVSLNMLQSRKSRPEDLVDTERAGGTRDEHAPDDPEEEAVVSDSVGLALLVVLDELTPAERLAFVLHDMFAVPFDEIAAIVDRSPAAARQLASRARRRVQHATPVAKTTPVGVYREGSAAAARTGRTSLASAFLAASREGNFEALLEMLAPDIVMRSDDAAVQMGVDKELHGPDAINRVFAGYTWSPVLAEVDGTEGLVWVVGGRPHVAFRLTVTDGRISAIDIKAELAEMDIALAG